jgi:hypothetical protein
MYNWNSLNISVNVTDHISYNKWDKIRATKVSKTRRSVDY